MKKTLPLVCALFFCAGFVARGELKMQPVTYKQGDAILEGYWVYDNAYHGKRPAVLVVHQWKGLTDYEKKRAQMLAGLGYNVFAVDIYGKGIRPESVEEAGKLAAKYKQDVPLLRARVKAGLEVLTESEFTDSKRVAVIGYCFGGTGALELARSGADIAGVVSFHGGLSTPHPGDAKNIKCKVLALQGADDPLVSPKEVQAFEEEMRNAKVDWQLVTYGGAVHAFTDWNAGSDNSKGVAYNEKADRRSWEAMRVFFGEIFQESAARH